MRNLIALALLWLGTSSFVAFPEDEHYVEAELEIQFATGHLIAQVSITNPMQDTYTFSRKEIGVHGYTVYPVFNVYEVQTGLRLRSRLPAFASNSVDRLEKLGPGDIYTVFFNLSKIYALEYDKIYSINYEVENLNYEPWGRIESAPIQVHMSEVVPEQWRSIF